MKLKYQHKSNYSYSESWLFSKFIYFTISLFFHIILVAIFYIFMRESPAQITKSFSIELIDSKNIKGSKKKKSYASLPSVKIKKTSNPKILPLVRTKPVTRKKKNLSKTKVKKVLVYIPVPLKSPNLEAKKRSKDVMPDELNKYKNSNISESKNKSLLNDSEDPLIAASYVIGKSGNRPPEYPKRARKNEFEGRVLLEVNVSPVGRSESVKVKNSSGYNILDEAAKDAVQSWIFTPARHFGTSVKSTIDVPIIFRLTYKN